ncbi:MAG: HAD family hydrolase [Deltaproteobacteria bacterium]|nr:MAG: HAD family hydrolase [Deltaproteobacteria bacterium]
MEAAIFDYDGTLVHLNIDFGVMRQDVEASLGEYGIAPEDLKGLYILEMIDEATGRISKESRSQGLTFYRKSHEIVIQHELAATKEGKILPGVVQMLQLLQERGVKVGVITRNCDKAVKMVFPHIERLCDVYIPRDRISRVKPHPEHLCLALEKLGVENASHCLMVGDHVLDVEGGKRMGMKTAGVLTGKTTRQQFTEAGADLILDDATQVLDHIFGGRRP